MSWIPEYKQDDLFRIPVPNYGLSHHSVLCSQCGSGANLEIDHDHTTLVVHHRYRVVCQSLACGAKTEWMDSSEEAIATWKMQRILTK